MKTINVKGTVRTETGKKASRDLRKTGAVPCNLYGEAKENGKPVAMSFTATQEELRKLVYSPDIYSVNLSIDGKECKAIMKELQFHPVTDRLQVPIKLNGLAEGVRAGGKLAASVRKLKIRAPYTAIPEHLDIDVTNLGLGKTIKVADLSFDGLEMVTSPSVVVCQVKMTRSAMSAASKGEDNSAAE